MNQDLNQLIKTLKTAKLTKLERQELWLNLTQELELAPAPSWWSFIVSRQVGYALATLVLTLALGAGVSQAAERAIPGDIFYPIKTKVQEPVERLLTAKTPAAQAQFETNLVERRLDEAEKLVKENKLDDNLKSTLKLQLVEQTARAATKEHEQEKEEPKEKEEIKKEPEQKLKAVLDEHREVLENLEIKSDFKPKNKDHEGDHDGNVRKESSDRRNKQGDHQD